MSLHTALLVTTTRIATLIPAYVKAFELGLPASPLMPTSGGRAYTFVVLATPATDHADAARLTLAREALRTWMADANAEAGLTQLEWIAVEYGRATNTGRILDHVPATPRLIDEEHDDDWWDDEETF
jgi:hypothetical protein